MLVRPAALLCMDEPTNHLDLAAREVLEEALAGFPGTIVFISHDRYFINRLATTVVEIIRGTLTRHPGDRKSTRLNCSHRCISYAVFCLKKKRNKSLTQRPDYNQLKEELETQNLVLKFDNNQLFSALALVGSVVCSVLASSLSYASDELC